MPSTIDEVLTSLDDLNRLGRGEWTSEGRKKISFRIDKIGFLQHVAGYVEAGRGNIQIGSCYLLEMWDTRTSPATIELFEAYNYQDLVFDEKKAAIGYCESNGRHAKIYIDRESFDNITRSICVFQQQGTVSCELYVQKVPEQTQLLVTDFYIRNTVVTKTFPREKEDKH